MSAAYDANLSALQLEGAEWLRARGRRLLADPPGFGKTRTVLAAVGEGKHLLVVCPAGIRDAQVWPDEAKRTGWDGQVTVISYHQLAKWGKEAPKKAWELGIEAVVFDESHWLKNRNVSWAHPAQRLGDVLEIVYESTGTPTPNVASELWGQLRVIKGKGGIPAYWKWAQGNGEGNTGWFHITQETDRAGRVLTDFAIEGHLEACVVAGDCPNAQPVYDTDYRKWRLKPVTDQDCEHWDRFREVELKDWLMARPEELLDLPPMSGEDTPIWTPMVATQKKAYKELQKDYLAEWAGFSADGVPVGNLIEAVNDSQKFVQLWQMSTGIGAVDPTADDRHSGKLKTMAEMLDDRQSQTLIACYFRNTGQILQNMCKRLGKSYVTFGANDTAKQRRDAIVRFQAGEVDVMIGSIAVVGEGVTLTAADGVWLAERMWTPDKNTQVIRRVRRRGQDKPVGVRQFITPDTIDAGQWGMLGLKLDRISQVDPVRLTYGEVVPR